MKVSRSNIRVKIGVRKTDRRCINIDEVERGLKCGCICAACGHPLVAKQGEIRDWHFAHAVQSNCERMGETHLHKAAKQILKDRKKVRLPEFRGREYGQKGKPDKEYLTESLLWSPYHQDLREKAMGIITKNELVQVEEVRVEESLDGIRPDIIMEKMGRFLLVEIRVTHETEEEKRKEISRRNLPCIEIDLSKTKRDISMKNLEGIVVGYASKPAPRKWLSHPKGEERATVQSKLRKEKFARRIERDGCKLVVQGAYGGIGSDVVNHCPIHDNQGKHQRRISDCISCKYHVAYFGSGDEDLHTELTGRKDSDVVYCNYVKLMAETAQHHEKKDTMQFEEPKREFVKVRGRNARKLKVHENIVELCPIDVYHEFNLIQTRIINCINCPHHVAHSGDIVYCGCKIR